VVRIRLRRMGANKKPYYRIVVANQQNSRDGRFIEIIGTYNPHTDPETISLKTDRAQHWLSVGAQPSDSVAIMFKRLNLIDAAGKPVAATDAAAA
jgi:small subunit ribosomal protein S16